MEEDLAWAKEYVEKMSWREAKSYAKTTPHEYIVVKEGDGWKYFAANGGGWQEDRFILNRAKAYLSY